MPGTADPGAMETLMALLKAGTKPTVPQTFDAYFAPQTFGKGWQTDYSPIAPPMPVKPAQAPPPDTGAAPPADAQAGGSFIERMMGAGGLKEGLMEMGPLGFLAGLFGHMFKTDDNPISQMFNRLGGSASKGGVGQGTAPIDPAVKPKGTLQDLLAAGGLGGGKL